MGSANPTHIVGCASTNDQFGRFLPLIVSAFVYMALHCSESLICSQILYAYVISMSYTSNQQLISYYLIFLIMI